MKLLNLKSVVVVLMALTGMAACGKDVQSEQPVANDKQKIESSESGGSTKKVGTNEIQLKKGMDYALARQQLLDAGWKVPKLPEGGYSAADAKVVSECAGSVSVCNRLPEIDSCSGDGMCVMQWTDPAGQPVMITVEGGLKEPSVSSWQKTGAAPQAKSNGDSCPSLSFDVFLKAYRERTHLQDVFTLDVVKYTYVAEIEDGGYGEKTVSKSKNDLDAPLIPSQETLKDSGTAVKVRQNGSNAFVTEQQKGTDALKEYRFVKQNGCWYLSAINNQSL